MTICERLRSLREANGLTQAAIADFIGVKRNTYTTYESGRIPDIDVIVKLSKYYSVSIDYLLGISTETVLQTDEHKLLALYRRSNATLRDIAMYVLSKHSDGNILDPKENVVPFAYSTSKELGDSLQYIVDFYNYPVSAGSGFPIDQPPSEKLTLIKQPPRGTSFINIISGDSMEPTFSDGDKIFVEARPSLDIGEIGIFRLNEDVYVKELGEGCLLSHNKKYSPILISSEDFIACQGRVLGICDKTYFY